MRPVRYSLSDASVDEQVGAPVPLDLYLTPFQVSLQVLVTGTATYTVEYTESDVYAEGYDPDTDTWTPMANMEDVIDNQQDTLISPVTAVRARQTAGNGSIDFTVIQGGVFG